MKSYIAVSVIVVAACVASVSGSQPCRLWLAPSHLSTNDKPKFGVYAGVDFRLNETLPNPDIAIPLVDIAADNYRFEESYSLHRDIISYLESIVWMASFAGATWEGNHSSIIFAPGLGSLVNFHTGTYNVDWVQGSVLLRDREGLEVPEKASVGRGAYSNYYNMTLRATQNIPAGMELYANFGDVWDISQEDLYQERLTRRDYEDADKLLNAIIDFMDTYEDHMKDGLKEEVLDFMLETILDAAGRKRAKLLRSLIPPVPSKLRKVKEMGGTFVYRNRDIIKSQKWLKKHGLCIDNLRSGKSTIPNAGRGAFATRDMKEGDVIAPVPMVPILSEELLEMYEVVEVPFDQENHMGLTYDRSKPIGSQLIMNYCFGHVESSLVLIPSSPMVSLVNHQEDANAYLGWSSHDHIGNDVLLLDLPLDEWDLAREPRLIMELVALKDIKEGDEIFIDYGPEWSIAWDEHVKRFMKSLPVSKWPLKAEDARVLFKNTPYPTDLKKATLPYPKGVFTACFIETEEVKDGEPKRNSAGHEILNWIGPKTFDAYSGYNLMVCDLKNRQESEEHFYTYTISTRFKDSTELVEVKNVPHVAVILLDKPYTSDMHSRSAFRHWIALEDERFPQAWRNLR